MILMLISPRNAGLPYADWLAEERGRLTAVTKAGTDLGEGFAEVITVPDYADGEAVLRAARDLAAAHPPRAVLAPGEMDVERAAVLRTELGLPGLPSATALAYRDKVVMKEYARAAGIRVPKFAPVNQPGDIADFMKQHPGRVVVKPRNASGSTGVQVYDTPAQTTAFERTAADTPYQVEEFVEGAMYHVDAFRVDGAPVATVTSRYTEAGCLAHWSDTPLGSVNLSGSDPLNATLQRETWRLVDALPSPETICVHAEFFVTPGGDVVLCEVGARIGGGPIPRMLRPVLGVDPRKMWSRVECGLPVDLEGIRRSVAAAPRAAFCGIPPRNGRVRRVPEAPAEVEDFVLHTHVGDDWTGDRYARRKSGDFLASWIATDGDGADLDRRVASTAEQVGAGFRWDGEQSAEAS